MTTRLSEKNSIVLMLSLCIVPVCIMMTVRCDSLMLLLAGAGIALIPELIILLIFVLLFKREKASPTLIRKARDIAAIWVFGLQSVLTVLKLTEISREYSGVFIGKALTVVLLTLTALYISLLTPQAIARTASGIILITGAVYIMIAAGAVKNADITNLNIASADPGGDIIKGMIAGAMISEGTAFYILVTGRSSKLGTGGAARFIIYRLVLMLTVFIPTAAVTGDRAKSAKLPVYELSTFSKGILTERFDGLFMMIFTLCAVIKAGTELYAVRAAVADLAAERAGKDEKA